MSLKSDYNAKRLTSAAYVSLVAIVLLGTMLLPQFKAASESALVLYAGVAVYVALTVFQWPKQHRPFQPWLVVLAQWILFCLLHLGRVPYNFLYLLAMPVISYAASNFRWYGVGGVMIAYIGAMTWFYQDGKFSLASALSVSGSMLAAFLFVVLFTRLLIISLESRDRSECLARELEQANAQLREQSAQAAALAAANERNRVARDIHDGLGHYLTVIAVQLEAAGALLPAEPTRAREAIGKAETLSREALDEVRRSVGALRAAAPATPLDAAVRGLVQEFGPSGRFVLRGAVSPLSSAVEQALFRAVQEGLTNARKHAAAAHVEVVLEFRPAGGVSVEVLDDGRGAQPGSVPLGFGLVGLRERLAAVGGSLSAGNRPERGFRLRAEVPA